MPWSPTPSQGGIRFFSYQQTTPSSTWNIYHAFGVTPLVDVNAYDDHGVLQKAFPLSVTHVDVNNVTITWSSPRKGFASLAAVPA